MELETRQATNESTTRTGKKVTADCCVVGGGPAGIVAGLLLARAGVRVTVLEKHGDLLRDFRGDTIHPSTLVGMGLRMERVRTREAVGDGGVATRP